MKTPSRSGTPEDNIKNLQNELDFIERKRLEALQAYINSLTKNPK